MSFALQASDSTVSVFVISGTTGWHEVVVSKKQKEVPKRCLMLTRLALPVDQLGDLLEDLPSEWFSSALVREKHSPTLSTRSAGYPSSMRASSDW